MDLNFFKSTLGLGNGSSNISKADRITLSNNLEEIISFMETQKDAMMSLQLKARRMMEKLYQNSDMSKTDVLNDNKYLFPKKIRRNLLHLVDKQFYIESSPFINEFNQLVNLYSRFLQQFRNYSAIVMPLVEEIKQLLLTKPEQVTHENYLSMLEDTFKKGINYYCAEFIELKKEKSPQSNN